MRGERIRWPAAVAALLGAMLIVLPSDSRGAPVHHLPPFPGLVASYNTTRSTSGCGFAKVMMPFVWNNTSSSALFSISASAAGCRVVNGSYFGEGSAVVVASVGIPVNLSNGWNTVSARLGISIDAKVGFNASLSATACPASPYNASGNCTAYAYCELSAAISIHDLTNGSWAVPHPVHRWPPFWRCYRGVYIYQNWYCYWQGWYCPYPLHTNRTFNATYAMNGSFVATHTYRLELNFTAFAYAANVGYDGRIWTKIDASGPGQGFHIYRVSVR